MDADKFLDSPTLYGKQLVTKKPIYECTVSFTYDADSPEDAAKQFIANLKSNDSWFIDVRDVGTNKTTTVDIDNNIY